MHLILLIWTFKDIVYNIVPKKSLSPDWDGMEFVHQCVFGNSL